ncbi:MAG: hypothetical protein QM831_43080 [Kofleriaceae bacterium]
MKNILFVAALSLSVFGCKKGGGAGDCDAAITHSMDLAKADMKKQGTDDKLMAKLADIGKQHCKDDKWSNDVIKCIMDAKTEGDGQACYGKLTKDQQDKMNKAAMDAVSASMGSANMGGGDMAGSAAPAAGSAAPAAGSAAPAGDMAGSAAPAAGSAAPAGDMAGSAAGSAAK